MNILPSFKSALLQNSENVFFRVSKLLELLELLELLVFCLNGRKSTQKLSERERFVMKFILLVCFVFVPPFD